MPAKKPPTPEAVIDRLATFIEAIIGEADTAIQLVDRDLVTGAVTVLFKDGARFAVTVTQCD